MITQSVLLDTHETWRRILQNGLPATGLALILAGSAVIIGPMRADFQGSLAVGIGLLLMAFAPRVLLRWNLQYKGHVIRFENSVVFGERLFIDDTRITSGIFGHRRSLQGIIRTGDGKGDRITAESEAGLTIFKVRILAEPAAEGA
jgi:hypothetical protein